MVRNKRKNNIESRITSNKLDNNLNLGCNQLNNKKFLEDLQKEIDKLILCSYYFLIKTKNKMKYWQLLFSDEYAKRNLNEAEGILTLYNRVCSKLSKRPDYWVREFGFSTIAILENYFKNLREVIAQSPKSNYELKVLEVCSLISVLFLKNRLLPVTRSQINNYLKVGFKKGLFDQKISLDSVGRVLSDLEKSNMIWKYIPLSRREHYFFPTVLFPGIFITDDILGNLKAYVQQILLEKDDLIYYFLPRGFIEFLKGNLSIEDYQLFQNTWATLLSNEFNYCKLFQNVYQEFREYMRENKDIALSEIQLLALYNFILFGMFLRFKFQNNSYFNYIFQHLYNFYESTNKPQILETLLTKKIETHTLKSCSKELQSKIIDCWKNWWQSVLFKGRIAFEELELIAPLDFETILSNLARFLESQISESAPPFLS